MALIVEVIDELVDLDASLNDKDLTRSNVFGQGGFLPLVIMESWISVKSNRNSELLS